MADAKRPLEILLVDDEPGMLEVYIETLRRGIERARLDATTEPRTAATWLDRGDYDLLVTNLHMPGMSGLRLLRLARERSPTMPVVVVTGYGMRETADEARILGAVDYVTKPFHPDDLLARIRTALGPTSVSH